ELGRRGIIAGFADADDVTVRVAELVRSALWVVVVSRIGGIGAVERAAAGVVVGERQVDLARLWIDRRPLRSVHGRGAERIGGEARVYEHVRLAGEDIFRSGAGGGTVRHLSVDERQPGSTAVGIEPGHIERACVEILVADRETVWGLGVGRIPGGGG